jgi:sugar phosphate isomerase/epimerase
VGFSHSEIEITELPAMPKIAFSTLACPTWDFEQIVTAGIRDGYDGVEIRQVGGETDLLTVPAFDRSRRGASREFLKRARTSAGSRSFSICGLASSVRFDYPQESERDAQFSIGKAYVELAAELEAGFVRVFGDVLPASSKSASSKPVERELALDQVADGLNRLGDFAAPHEIDILLETHGDFADSRAVKDLFGRINSPRVGVLWDTHHPWRFYEESPESTFTNLKPWIRHTHWKDSVTLPHVAAATNSVSDAEQGAFALMSGHRHADYVLFGGGEFPIAQFVRLLKDSGYDGWLSLEWEKMWHPELAGPEVALPLFAKKMREFWSMA